MERRDKFVDNSTSFAYATYNMIDEYGIDMPVSGSFHKLKREIVSKIIYTEFIPLIKPNKFAFRYCYDLMSLFYMDKTSDIFKGKSEDEFIESFECLTTTIEQNLFCLNKILLPLQLYAIKSGDAIKLNIKCAKKKKSTFGVVFIKFSDNCPRTMSGRFLRYQSNAKGWKDSIQ